MWQLSNSNISKHHTNKYEDYHRTTTDSTKRQRKSTSSHSKYKYTVPTKQYECDTTLSEAAQLRSIMVPQPPISLPSLPSCKSSVPSTQSAFAYNPSYKQITPWIEAGAITPPEQINANSHFEYSSFPSTFHLFQQHNMKNTKNDDYKERKCSKKHKHKRSRTKVRLQLSSLPPPPTITIASSQSVPAPCRSQSYTVTSRSDLQPSESFSNSSTMQPIPEDFNIYPCTISRRKSQTQLSNDILIEVDEDLEDIEVERMAIKNARRKRLSVSRSMVSDRVIRPNSLQEIQRIKQKNVKSDTFWEHNRKIPFIGLAMATSTFFICIFVYFTNLYSLLFGGLVPCILGLLMIVPIYYFFSKYDKTLDCKSAVIEDQDKDEMCLRDKNQVLLVKNNELNNKNDDLMNSLLYKLDIISKHKEEIRDLSELIAERQQIEPPRKSISVKSKPKPYNPIKKCSLLDGLLRGELEVQLEMADIDDLVHMLPIITSCITLMPFGMSQRRKKLQRILESKISDNGYIKMQFYLFLVSYLGCLDVQRLFRKHKLMKYVNETSDFYKYSWDDMMERCGYLNNGDRVYSIQRKDSVLSDETHQTFTTLATMASPKDDGSILGDIYGQCSMAVLTPHGDEHKNYDDAVVIECEETMVYTEKDPVKLFRMPLDRDAAVGFTVLLPSKLQNRFFDPINGNKCVEQLKVRKIFKTNARPYLIDIYVNEETTNRMFLSSSYILKQGDDLRKDGAVLKMFELMNEIWKSSDLKYKDSFVSSLIYKCIPMGPNIGMIEVIPNCIELNRVMSLRQKLQNKKNIHLYNKLVASSAGAFIAAFVMGIRDRHDDNILINTAEDGYNLFHIDFGYMFGDRVPLDTAKLAITSGLKNVFDIYDYGWNDFIDICIKSWLILRNNANQVIDYARVVFAFLYETNQIELFFRNSLKLDVADDDAAAKYIHDKLKNAPKHLKTKVKNLVHGFAQKMK